MYLLTLTCRISQNNEQTDDYHEQNRGFSMSRYLCKSYSMKGHEQTRMAYSLWKAGSQELIKRSYLYISAIFKDNTEIPQRREE